MPQPNEAYLSFLSMKRLGVLLPFHGWQGFPQRFSGLPLLLYIGVKCFTQEHNTLTCLGLKPRSDFSRPESGALTVRSPPLPCDIIINIVIISPMRRNQSIKIHGYCRAQSIFNS